MRGFGIFLAVAGVVLIAIGFLYDTSIEVDSSFSQLGGYTPASSVINIGMLQIQELMVMTGLFMTLVGTVMGSVGELIFRLEQSGVLKPKPDPTPFAHKGAEGSVCAWCDQTVYLPNKPCSDADTELLRTRYPDMNNARCRAAIEARGLD